MTCQATKMQFLQVLICHPSFNFYSVHKASNDTGHVNRLTSITFHVGTANILTSQKLRNMRVSKCNLEGNERNNPN